MATVTGYPGSFQRNGKQKGTDYRRVEGKEEKEEGADGSNAGVAL